MNNFEESASHDYSETISLAFLSSGSTTHCSGKRTFSVWLLQAYMPPMVRKRMSRYLNSAYMVDTARLVSCMELDLVIRSRYGAVRQLRPIRRTLLLPPLETGSGFFPTYCALGDPCGTRSIYYERCPLSERTA